LIKGRGTWGKETGRGKNEERGGKRKGRGFAYLSREGGEKKGKKKEKASYTIGAPPFHKEKP